MRRHTLTFSIYSLAAVAASLSWVIRQQEDGLSAVLVRWCLWFAAPLLFAFAYPRFLFADFLPQSARPRSAAIFHAVGAGVATVLFVVLGSHFWRNPLRDVNSILFELVLIVVESAFLAAALILLLKNRFTLAKFASLLFWPYWLAIVLLFVGRFFDANVFRAASCFACVLSSMLFAFAAGAVPCRPLVAHASALAGLVSMPWIYWSTLQDTALGNIWTVFNGSGRDFLNHSTLRLAQIIIVSVGIIVLAVATSALRLVPRRWTLRKRPVCERTWPAFVASFLFLAVWFGQSVMPYRISGAVDYSHWPMLQILHVEKRGLQFHETCVSVWGWHNEPESITLSENDRRLFEYRFQEKGSSGDLSEPLKEHIQTVLQSLDTSSRSWPAIKPLRAWNDDGWFVRAENIGLKVYTSDRGSVPPQEIVDLSAELEQVPRGRETQSEMRDVCLGFCYDPLSGLGLLYANHRCHWDGHDYSCH